MNGVSDVDTVDADLDAVGRAELGIFRDVALDPGPLTRSKDCRKSNSPRRRRSHRGIQLHGKRGVVEIGQRLQKAASRRDAGFWQVDARSSRLVVITERSQLSGHGCAKSSEARASPDHRERVVEDVAEWLRVFAEEETAWKDVARRPNMKMEPWQRAKCRQCAVIALQDADALVPIRRDAFAYGDDGGVDLGVGGSNVGDDLASVGAEEILDRFQKTSEVFPDGRGSTFEAEQRVESDAVDTEAVGQLDLLIESSPALAVDELL